MPRPDCGIYVFADRRVEVRSVLRPGGEDELQDMRGVRGGEGVTTSGGPGRGGGLP